MDIEKNADFVHAKGPDAITIMNEILNINMIIAKIITIELIFFFNYFSRSMIIFRRRF